MSKDFKLRALKSVLVMAGDLKRAAGDLPEDKASYIPRKGAGTCPVVTFGTRQLASRLLFHLNSRGVVLGSTKKNTSTPLMYQRVKEDQAKMQGADASLA